MNLGVNGRFLSAPVTGVQRFGREVLTHIAAVRGVTLLVPRDAAVPNDFRGDVVRGRAAGHPWEQLELPGAARAARCDVVLHPANTAPLRGRRSVVVVHDLFPLSNPEWFTRRYVLWQRFVIAPALRRASALFTASEWGRGELARVLGVSSERIGVVPQGLAPFDVPAAADAVARARRRHGLPERYVIAFGGRDPRKNVRFLMPVADAMASRCPELAFVIVGGGHRRVHPSDQGVVARPTLRVLGHLETSELHALLTGASALCFPSLAEGFGRPPLEALACGTPALVGAYGAAREVLGEAGSILPFDPDAWVEKLGAVLNDGGARARALGDSEPLLRRFTWRAAADVLIEACERVARAPA